MGNEIRSGAVALNGEAGVQYVVYSSGVIAFACQIGAAVVGGVAQRRCGIGQIALHVRQGGRVGGAVVAAVHGGNNIACANLGTCAVRLGVEVAVGVFIHFAAIGLGIHHRGLGILGNLLRIERVGEFAAVLRYGQPVACFQRQGVACFNQLLGRRCACGVAAGGGFEAAVVDGVGNIACGYQFACICASRNGYFARICACGWCSQGNGVHTYFIWACCAAIAGYGYRAVIGSLNFGFGSLNRIVNGVLTCATNIAHRNIAVSVYCSIATQDSFNRVTNITQCFLGGVQLAAVNGIGARGRNFPWCNVFDLTFKACITN